MAESGGTPPAVGDVEGRRAMWEPIIGAASAAQPIPANVRRRTVAAPSGWATVWTGPSESAVAAATTAIRPRVRRGTEPPGDLCKVPAAPRRPFAWGGESERGERDAVSSRVAFYAGRTSALLVARCESRAPTRCVTRFAVDAGFGTRRSRVPQADP